MKYFYLFTTLFIFITTCNQSNVQKQNNCFDDDNMTLINGKRTFIIGSYHHPKTTDPYAELARNGYNYVKVNADNAELDKALQNGLYTWIYTNAIDGNNTITGRKELTKKVEALKNHPALLFWEIEDEPAYTWNSAKARVSPERMKKTFDMIKSEDKNHAVITNHAPVNLISTLKKYNNSCDLVAVDVYPVVPHGIIPTYALCRDGLQGDLLNPYLSQVGEYVDKMKTIVGNSKPVFAVLQGFSWEMLKPEAERDTSMILYPTYEQSRFMMYNAIVHGANGILIWGTNYTPHPSKFMDDLNRATRELAMMQEILSAKNTKNKIEVKYHEMGNSVDTGIEFITKRMNGKLYLISVNSDKNPVKVTFSGLSNLNIVTVLKENRTLKIENGLFTCEYKPFDVHIYEIE